MSIFGIILVFLLIATGFYILLTPSFEYVPRYFRTVFVVLIFGYGLYRSVNIFNHYKNKEDKK